MKKTKAIDINIAVVDQVLSEGVYARDDIRLEIPLDVNSSGGRADIVLLGKDHIGCIETKSGSDKIEGLKDQVIGYNMVFDHVLPILDSRFIEKSPIRHQVLFHYPDLGFVGENGWPDRQPNHVEIKVLRRDYLAGPG